jgi:hypothetical protein
MHYASGTFTKEIESLDEQNLTALLIAWQGGDGTIRDVSDAQWADNKFGTPVEWFVNALNGIIARADAMKPAIDAAIAAANRAEAAAKAAEDAAKAALAAVQALDTGGGTGGPVTVEVYAGLPGASAVKLGSVDV